MINRKIEHAYCCKCNRQMEKTVNIRYLAKEQSEYQDVSSAPNWEFCSHLLDLSKPICAICAGVYKKTLIDYQIERAIKGLEKVRKSEI